MKTLTWFYEQMQSTIGPRRELVRSCLLKEPPKQEYLDHLKNTLEKLLEISSKNQMAILNMDQDKQIELELSYEINELQKDIIFLEEGTESLENLFVENNSKFKTETATLFNFLKRFPVNNWITDRDGTINNYCGRYLSSIQSVYNAIFVADFAQTNKNSCILTSAPLTNKGLIDISVLPPGKIILAGSKGREYMAPNGTIGSYPIPEVQQIKLAELNRELTYLLEDDQYSIFKMIGSGLQLKFGQTTIARQDVSGSISDLKTTAFLIKVTNLVKRLDPEKEYFRIEDTGLDIEIMLTVSARESTDLKDFDKGDGLSFLNTELALNLSDGLTLVCGDTFSDLSLVETSQNLSKETAAVFVTIDKKLKKELGSICPNSFVVSSPDVLVWTLMMIAKEQK